MPFDPLGGSPEGDGRRALVAPGGVLSRAELRRRVDDRARALDADGAPAVRPLEIEPDAAGIVELLATWRAGRVAAPLNPRLSGAAKEAARTAFEAGGSGGAPIPEESCVVLWTSGTSGRPRGVALSADNLTAITRAAEVRLGLAADDVWLASLSPAHVGGLALVVRALQLGGTLLAYGRYELEGTVRLLRADGGPTRLSLVPTQLHQLLDRWGPGPAPARLRSVLVGGAHAPRRLVDRAVAAGWPVALTWGATEMSSQIATAAPDEVAEGARDVGRPLDGVEVRVADDGSLLARGPTRALGYVGTDRPLADGDGWYHTGDLGAIDGRGRLSITGRRIDRIVSGGVTLDAVSIEEALRGHPSVFDVCVVGVPDEVWGERVAAWVHPVEGEYDPDEIERWASEALGPAARPRLWLRGGALPRNPNGKVDRGAVRERLSAGPARKA